MISHSFKKKKKSSVYNQTISKKKKKKKIMYPSIKRPNFSLTYSNLKITKTQICTWLLLLLKSETILD